MNKYVLILTLILLAVISCRPRYYGDRPRPPRPHRNDTNRTDPEPRPRPPRPPRPHRNDTNRTEPDVENGEEENNLFSFFKKMSIHNPPKFPKIPGFPKVPKVDIEVPDPQFPKFPPRNNTNKPFPFPRRPIRKYPVSI